MKAGNCQNHHRETEPERVIAFSGPYNYGEIAINRILVYSASCLHCSKLENFYPKFSNPLEF